MAMHEHDKDTYMYQYEHRNGKVYNIVKEYIHFIHKDVYPWHFTALKKLFCDKHYREELRIKWKYRERRVTFGNENKDKTFYVLRMARLVGIGSACTNYLSKFIYAKDRGYIPVVDQLTSFVPRFKSLIGKENIWEYYFEQPAEYTLEDIKRSKNVILGNAIQRTPIEKPMNWLSYDYYKDATYWNTIAEQYIRLNEITKKHIDEEYVKVIPKDKRILGMAIRREMDICTNNGLLANVNNHPKNPSLDQQIGLAKEKMQEWNCEYIFCMSDDKEALDIMKEEFGEKLLWIERERLELFKNNKVNDASKVVSAEHDFISEQGAYKVTLDYITEVVILSKCTALMGNRNGGTLMASIWNAGKYEYLEIYDKGRHEFGKTYLKMKDGFVDSVVV